jgi:hypothetical protein
MSGEQLNPYESPQTSNAREPVIHRHEVDEEILELQAYVDRLLSRAVIYSIFWVAGAGSLYSILLVTSVLAMVLING